MSKGILIWNILGQSNLTHRGVDIFEQEEGNADSERSI